MIFTHVFKKCINNILIVFYSLLRREAFLLRFSKKFDKRMVSSVLARI